MASRRNCSKRRRGRFGRVVADVKAQLAGEFREGQGDLLGLLSGDPPDQVGSRP